MGGMNVGLSDQLLAPDVSDLARRAIDLLRKIIVQTVPPSFGVF